MRERTSGKELAKAIGLALLPWVVLLAVALDSGCVDDGCKSGSTRCRNNRVEQCDYEDNDGDATDGDWGMVINCDEYGWICCDGFPYGGEDEHNCVPAPTCEAWYADGGLS